MDDILALLGMQGTLKALGPGMFYLAADQGDRLVLASRGKPLETSDAIAVWLAAQGLHVMAPLPGYPRTDGDLRVSAYPWRDTREVTPDDLPAFGKALRRLHDTLGRHPDRARWRGVTDQNLLNLSAIRARIASGEIKAGPYYEGIADLARNEDYDFVMYGHPRIACHMGDARMDAGTGDILFLNFGNVPASYLPAVFEFARIVERHVLLPGAGLPRARGFLQNYGVEGRVKLGNAMMADIVRSCCELAAAADASADEWQKIFDRYNLIRRNEAALNDLEV